MRCAQLVRSRRPFLGGGGKVGTARDDLLALLQEATFRIRKNFGMFSQIQLCIEDITPERLTVSIWTERPLDGAGVAANVRNAVLNWLQDMIPVERFVAVYDNPALGISGEIHDLPYARELPRAGTLESSELLIEENAGPAREELRPRLRQAWTRLL